MINSLIQINMKSLPGFPMISSFFLYICSNSIRIRRLQRHNGRPHKSHTCSTSFFTFTSSCVHFLAVENDNGINAWLRPLRQRGAQWRDTGHCPGIRRTSHCSHLSPLTCKLTAKMSNGSQSKEKWRRSAPSPGHISNYYEVPPHVPPLPSFRPLFSNVSRWFAVLKQ